LEEIVPVMTKKSQADMTPDQALASLREGNERFVSGKSRQRDLIAQVRATASGQYPLALLLSCIDSRIPPELVFDQGIGAVFSARVAGNFANADIIGGAEFATKLAGAPLILVLGHTECAAVKGACDNIHLGDPTHILAKITPAVDAVTNVQGDRSSKNKEFVQQVSEENVRLTVKALTERSAVLRDLVERRELKVVGAMLDVATGRVTFAV
jgi:carbonic anhydrase